MRRTAPRRLVPVLVPLLLVGACSPSPAPPRATSPAEPVNVVFFVGDGFGLGAWAVGRAWLKSLGVDPALDEAEHLGLVDTRAEDELVTDSAAAATAWAVGRAGLNGEIGFPEDPTAVPIFQRLAAAGRAAGLVTTTRVTHATPAPFYARVGNRGREDEIAAQLVESMPQVAIGGGRRHFLPRGAGGTRRDGRDLLAEAREKGFVVLDSLVTPLPADRRVLLLLADSHLPHETDRRGGPDLADLTVAAIRRLAADGPGWFLLVEEGKIDHASHVHDGPSIAFDVGRLDRAVAAALRETDRARTLVVVTADHGTGNPNLHENAHPESLDVVSMSIDRMDSLLFGDAPWRGTPAALQEKALPILMEGARHPGLSARDLDRLVATKDPGDRSAALGTAISRRFGILFMDFEDHVASKRRGGHTGEPVPVFTWGPRSAEVSRVRDHAALGRWLADVLGLPPVAESAGPRVAATDSPGGNAGDEPRHPAAH